jgi:3-oxoacyl-[acyl-carrier-protein] synthase I
MSMVTPGSPLPAVAVIGMGASCPIGHGVRPIQAAMAGGLRNFQEAARPGFDGEPIRISRLPDVDESVAREERIETLARRAVANLFESTSALAIPRDIPIFAGMAHESSESDLAAITRALSEESHGLLDSDCVANPVGYRGGRIAFLSALAMAIRWFESGASEVALVIAADSRCTWGAVDALFRQRRLLSSEDDGTIPGEAAVIALVAAPQSRLAIQQAQFLICDPAFGQDEFATIRCSPQATDGLSCAFRALREHPMIGAVRPTAVVAFETGELCFTRTFSTGYLRNAELMPEPLQHELIATNLGDTGAAAGGMALIRADGMMRQHDGDTSPRILIYGHSDSGRCAAAVAIGR